MDRGVVEAAAGIVQEAVNPDANIIFGATFDDGMEDTMRVTVIATGFDDIGGVSGGLFSAASEKAAEPAAPAAPSISDIDDIFRIFNRK